MGNLFYNRELLELVIVSIILVMCNSGVIYCKEKLEAGHSLESVFE